jgi:hypothetical protein
MRYTGLDYLSVYDVFEVYTYTAQSYAKCVGVFGELDRTVRNFATVADVMRKEITRRDQWGRYNFYTYNPELFPNHPRIRPL